MNDQHEEEVDESVDDLLSQLDNLSVQVNAKCIITALSAIYEKHCFCKACEKSVFHFETVLLSIDLNDQWKQMLISAIGRHRNDRSKLREKRNKAIERIQRLFGTRQSDEGSTG